MYLVPEAHEPDEGVRETQQVSGILGRPHSRIHTPTTSSNRHQESSHNVEQGENVAPVHHEKHKVRGFGFTCLRTRV